MRLRETPLKDPARQIGNYQMDAARHAQALDAVRAFNAHTPGRLNEAEQAELVERLRSILSDEQRDDLRAALGRRPVVQLAENSTVSIEPVR
jgi:Xaa-Pro aminopeptidase